jgi:uncharacterized protein (UPF0332 family)
MTFDDLLADRSIEPADVGADEIAELVRVARRDVATATVLLGTDLDWAFAVAYNAMLQSSVAYMAARGYRPRSHGKHFNVFRFMAEARPDEAELMMRLQRIRKKRHATVYEHVGIIGEAEARDALELATRYVAMVAAGLPAEVRTLLNEEE